MGKIPTGELLKISPTRVPRLIGKRGSMIQTIEQASSTRITIGQNGIIVVSGNDKEGITLAINAIHIVEVEDSYIKPNAENKAIIECTRIRD